MAVVLLETAVLAPAADLAAQVELDVDSLRDDDGVMGEVRTYAGGRRRSISRAGAMRQIPISFDVLADERALVLGRVQQWCGQVVLYRDPRGRKAWAVYYQVSVNENVAVDVAQVSLTLVEVSFDEAV